MTTTSHFDSLDDLDKLVAMGMEEGMKQAQGQIDDIVAFLRTLSDGYSAYKPSPPTLAGSGTAPAPQSPN